MATHTYTFAGCKHLDFSPNYDAKRQLTTKGLFWMREREPQMVQFCKKRGRIYGCESCLSLATAQCGMYEEIQHSIDVPNAEIES